MSPLQIEILLWYHSRTADFRDGDFSAPAVRWAIDDFRDQTRMLEAQSKFPGQTYRLTPRGRAYVAFLLQVPLPECRWEVELP